MEHLILSHHGKLEFGSPKVPLFPEALLLHYIDDMDSKMECMRVLIDKEPLAEGYFTGYSGALERVALRKTRYLEQQPSPASTNSAAPNSATPVTPADCANPIDFNQNPRKRDHPQLKRFGPSLLRFPVWSQTPRSAAGRKEISSWPETVNFLPRSKCCA